VTLCDLHGSYEGNHGRVHMWLGGHMSSLPCAPCDPLFFSHHCMVDKIAEDLRDRVSDANWWYPTRNAPWRHRGIVLRPDLQTSDDLCMILYTY